MCLDLRYNWVSGHYYNEGTYYNDTSVSLIFSRVTMTTLRLSKPHTVAVLLNSRVSIHHRPFHSIVIIACEGLDKEGEGLSAPCIMVSMVTGLY